MKKTLLMAGLATLSLSMPLAWTDETHHAGQDKQPATAMSDPGAPMQMGKMQENMLRMHEQMHKIMQSKNAKEREKYMQQHLKMMQDNMQMMQSMKGGGMMGRGQMGGDAKGGMPGQ